MRIQENPQTVSFTIFNADTLDPITVFLQDFGGGCGRMIVECWCTAWAAYWGAMGSVNVREFVLDAHADYIVNRMRPQDRKHLKRDEAYLLRIVKVVQQALREGASAAGVPPSDGGQPLSMSMFASREDYEAATAKRKLTMRISYERAGRCFWHLQCKAQHHAPPMKIERDDKDGKRTLLRCTACERAGWYPHGSVGEVCCEEAPDGSGVAVAPARLLVTVCELRDGDGLAHCAMLHHEGQRAMDGMCVERRADRSEAEGEAAEWREFLAAGVAVAPRAEPSDEELDELAMRVCGVLHGDVLHMDRKQRIAYARRVLALGVRPSDGGQSNG